MTPEHSGAGTTDAAPAARTDHRAGSDVPARSGCPMHAVTSSPADATGASAQPHPTADGGHDATGHAYETPVHPHETHVPAHRYVPAHGSADGLATGGAPSVAVGAQDDVLQAVIRLASHLDLTTVLSTFVETAARLSGARYAAIGVLDAYGET